MHSVHCTRKCNCSYISIVEVMLADTVGSQDVLDACMAQAFLEQDN
jgi:hypothetical protein